MNFKAFLFTLKCNTKLDAICLPFKDGFFDMFMTAVVLQFTVLFCILAFIFQLLILLLSPLFLVLSCFFSLWWSDEKLEKQKQLRVRWRYENGLDEE